VARVSAATTMSAISMSAGVVSRRTALVDSPGSARSVSAFDGATPFGDRSVRAAPSGAPTPVSAVVFVGSSPASVSRASPARAVSVRAVSVSAVSVSAVSVSAVSVSAIASRGSTSP
jgi:hypothetical protein